MTTVSRILPLPCWRRFVVLAFVLGASACLPPTLFAWSRSGLSSTEYWRMTSGQWIHLGIGHLALNLSALMVICLLFKRNQPLIEWVGYLLVSPLVISLGLVW